MFLLAGWISRQQLLVIEYLKAENRMLRDRLNWRSLRFSDRERALRMTYYLLFVIELAKHIVHIAGITTRHDESWMLQVGRNLTDAINGVLIGKRYSNEGNPPEALHIHVRLGGSSAKFWVHPEVRLASNYGFDAPTLNELASVVEQNREVIERAWNEHFG